MEILGWILSWILDRVVPDVRMALGNRGCLLTLVVTAAVIPAYLLRSQGEDWGTVLIVGPLASIAVVVMVMMTYGLARRSRTEPGEGGASESPNDQEPADWSIGEEPLTRDIKALVRAIPEGILQYVQTGTKECPYCAETINARAIVCKFCGRNTYLLRSGSPVESSGQADDERPPRAGPGGGPTLADTGGRTSVCTQCGARNPTDSAFCGECGAQDSMLRSGEGSFTDRERRSP